MRNYHARYSKPVLAPRPGVRGTGDRIRNERIKTGIASKLLGEILGVNESALYHWELLGILPRVQMLIDLAIYFKVPLEQLLDTDTASGDINERYKPR